MNTPTFKEVAGTHNDAVDLVDNNGTTIRVQNSVVVDQAVKFLCKCQPEVRAKVIAELINPNQWAVPLNQICDLTYHPASASFTHEKHLYQSE